VIKVGLVNEEKLENFVRKIVLTMKPELKSNISGQDLKRLERLSSREWLNAQDSASYLGISVSTFQKWRKKYDIPSMTIENITRWKKSDLDNFWKRRGVKGYL